MHVLHTIERKISSFARVKPLLKDNTSDKMLTILRETINRISRIEPSRLISMHSRPASVVLPGRVVSPGVTLQLKKRPQSFGQQCIHVCTYTCVELQCQKLLTRVLAENESEGSAWNKAERERESNREGLIRERREF